MVNKMRLKSQHISSNEIILLPLALSQTTNFRLFQIERVCRRQFYKFDENSEMLPKQVENTEGKGEIAHYEQFLLFPQCFQRTCAADT